MIDVALQTPSVGPETEPEDSGVKAIGSVGAIKGMTATGCPVLCAVRVGM